MILRRLTTAFRKQFTVDEGILGHRELLAETLKVNATLQARLEAPTP
jgi:hypothetical protein